MIDIATTLRRKPLLWDNYPVNDAQRLTPFLHIKPPSNRSGDLRDLTSGHLANPMNQPYLSQLPLHALAALYADTSTTSASRFAAACEALCPPALAAALQQDADVLQAKGLDALDAQAKEGFVRKYAGFDHPMAGEVCGWLRGEYVFDPACLT
jgi:hypothetical protein